MNKYIKMKQPLILEIFREKLIYNEVGKRIRKTYECLTSYKTNIPEKVIRVRGGTPVIRIMQNSHEIVSV